MFMNGMLKLENEQTLDVVYKTNMSVESVSVRDARLKFIYSVFHIVISWNRSSNSHVCVHNGTNTVNC